MNVAGVALRHVRVVGVGIAAAVSVLVGSGSSVAQEPVRLPIVFVHGAAGSGAQYETQSRRFDSNGYSDVLVRAFEYDSSFATNTSRRSSHGLTRSSRHFFPSSTSSR